MKRAYRLRLRASTATPYRWVGYGRPVVTEQMLMGALGEATVHSLNSANPDAPDMDVEIRARSPEEAAMNLLAGLQSVGLDATRIVVIDMLRASLQRAVLGGTGLGALGLSTKNPWVALGCAAVGAIVGYAADLALNEAWAMIVAERVGFPNSWRFTSVPAPPWSPRTA